MSLELIPMLLLSLLLMTAGGDVGTVELVVGGEQEVTDNPGGVIVGDARVTVPADATLTGPLHQLGGEVRIVGAVTGDVVQLAGTLLVDDGASIAGTLQHVSGTLHVAPGAQVARRATLDVVTREPGPLGHLAPFALVTGLLAFIGARRARHRPLAQENARNAVERHPLISLTVGVLVTVTFLSLFVFMAFTLVLLPVSVLGLGGGLVTAGYGVITLGAVVARRLPIASPGPASAAGVAAVMVALWLMGAIPIVGNLAAGGLLLTGLGSVLLTYFGLKEFTPVPLPG